MNTSGSIDRAIALIDAANAADPTLEQGEPAALLYGRRMSAELENLFPDASAVLRIATRGQHIERWLLPRSDFPEGKEGYLLWRREQARRHAERVAKIMQESGFGPPECDRAGVLLRKEGLKKDAEVQALEDVICFTFLRWYFQPFANSRTKDSLIEIVTKTARKMSSEARGRALTEFSLPEPFAAAFRI
jgi:hypothetical protein